LAIKALDARGKLLPENPVTYFCGLRPAII